MRTRGLASAFKVLNNRRKQNQIASLTGSLESCLEGTLPLQASEFEMRVYI